MNKIVVTTGNIILIGNVVEQEHGIDIDKPYSITLTPNGYELQPFLEKFTGQNWKEIFLKDKDILSMVEAENNELLQAYLSKISGLDISQPEIILHG